MKPEKFAAGMFKKRKKELALAAIALLLAAVAVLYFTGGEPGSPEESVVVKVIDTMANSLNPAKTDSPKNEFVEEYDFELSGQAMESLEEMAKASVEAGYRLDFETHNTDATMKHGGEACSAKMGLAGNGLSHYNSEKKSFRVEAECPDGEKKSLNFFIPLERDYFGLLYAGYLAGKLGLLSPEREIALVKFNGKPQGLYVVEENWDETLLERIREPSLSIVRRSENWIKDHPEAMGGEADHSAGVTNPTRHFTPFDLEISNFKGTGPGFGSEVVYKVGQMLEAAETNDQNRFEYVFDLENSAKVETYRAILGQNHDFIGDNTWLFYDSATDKFWLVPRSEGGIIAIEERKGAIEWHLGSWKETPEPVLEYIFRNPGLRNRRNEIIWQLLQEKDQLTGHYEELEQKYSQLFQLDKTDKLRSSKIAYYIARNRNSLGQNIEILEKQFAYSKVYVNITQKDNAITIEIMPDATTALKIDNLTIKLNPGRSQEAQTATATAFDEKGEKTAEETIATAQNTIDLAQLANKNLIQADLDEDMQPTKTTFRYEIKFQNNIDINSAEITAQNAITGKTIPPEDTYVGIAKGDDDYSGLQSQSKQGFLDSHPELNFVEKGGVLHLVEGEYEVKENAVIPKNLGIVIDAGVKIRIGPGKSIVSYSGLDIQGTGENPVVVSRLDESKAFGVVGIIGNGQTKTTIRHLQLSGGSEKFINGIFFSGQLSVYHSDLDIFDSKLSRSSSDDGMNVKYANVVIENTEFSDNAGDQVDLDFCNGVVRNSRFNAMEMKNPDGDGLDISGSSIIALDSEFVGNGDKGISIGEESWIVVYNSLVSGNIMGSAVKDNSKAFFVKDAFEGNDTAIAAYEKKPIFGGASFYIYDNLFEGNKDKISLDGKSDYGNISFSGGELALLEKMAAAVNIEGLKEMLGAKG